MPDCLFCGERQTRGKTKCQRTRQMQAIHQGTGEDNQGTRQTNTRQETHQGRYKVSEMREEISKPKTFDEIKKREREKHEHMVNNHDKTYHRSCSGAELWIIVPRKQGKDLCNDLLKGKKIIINK